MVLKNTKIYNVINEKIYGSTAFVTIDYTYKEIIISFGVKLLPYDPYKSNFYYYEPSVAKDAMTHVKFIKYAESLINEANSDFLNLFNQPEYLNYSLILTGHDMGGITAMFSAIVFQKKYNIQSSRIAIYTYGQSRVGNQAFSFWYNNNFPNYYRIVSGRDFASHLPFQIFDYYHAGQEIFIDDYGNANFCSRGQEDPNCSNQYYVFNRDKHFHMGSTSLKDPHCK